MPTQRLYIPNSKPNLHSMKIEEKSISVSLPPTIIVQIPGKIKILSTNKEYILLIYY
jgi:hypothetical protein